MVVNRSAPPGAVVPVLVYEDVNRAIAWLAGAFGFQERLRTPSEPDGAIHHAQMAVGPGAVMLTSGSRASTQCVYVQVQDLDAHFERARAFGAKIVGEPVNCAFGERQYSVEDLEGNRWTFSKSIADIGPEEWGAQVSDLSERQELLPRPRFCYLQIPAIDVYRSAAFYEKVFGWKIRGRESEHPTFDAFGSISGSWTTGQAIQSEPGLLPYIWVDRLDATLKLVADNGGGVVESPHLDAPGGSRIATVRDPAGNILGLYEQIAY